MKKTREIRNRWTGEIIHSGEYNTLREAVVFAVGSKIVLRDAVLSGAYLRDADLSDSGKIPAIVNIHQEIYKAASQEDALDMSTWHTCETTNCHAGWVIALAGAAGSAMEFCLGTAAAAALIYQASDPKLEKIPDFYADNVEALDDMKRLAELESENA